MQTSSRIRTIIFCSLALILLQGCTTPFSRSLKSIPTTNSDQGANGGIEKSIDLIANDFVNAMKQIPSLEPSLITVELLRDQKSDDLILAFEEILEQAGYGVRWVAEPTANHLLQYRREQVSIPDATEHTRLDIAVGTVELRRSYSGVSTNQVEPITPLYIRGADATFVVLDDIAFFRYAKTQPDGLVPLTVPNNINPLSGLVASATNANPLDQVGSIEPGNIKNVFDIGGSNYASALSEHEVVLEQVLMFPNDSLRLGSTNKQLVNNLVTRFDPNTDLFSVIGCSFGQTNMEGSNAALALGRASRVREALLFAGVDQNKILDEGCWAGDSSMSALPSRGVVVTLNRQSL